MLYDIKNHSPLQQKAQHVVLFLFTKSIFSVLLSKKNMRTAKITLVLCQMLG